LNPLPHCSEEHPIDSQIRQIESSSSLGSEIKKALVGLKIEYNDLRLEDLKYKVEKSLQEEYPSLKKSLIEENRNKAMQDSLDAIHRCLTTSLQIKSFQGYKKPSDFVISNSEMSSNARQIEFERNSAGMLSRPPGDPQFQATTPSVVRTTGESLLPHGQGFNLNSLSTQSKLRQGIHLSPNNYSTQSKDRFADPSALYLPEPQVKLHLRYKDFLFGPPANDIILMGLEKRQPRICLISRMSLASGVVPTCITSINPNCICVGTASGELIISDFQGQSVIKVATQRINSLKADNEYIYCGATSADSDGLVVLEIRDTTKRHMMMSGSNTKGTMAIIHVKKPGSFTTVGLDGCVYYWSLSKSLIAPLASIKLPIDVSLAGVAYKQTECRLYFSSPSEIIEFDEKSKLYRQFQNSAGSIGLDTNLESPGYLVSYHPKGLVQRWSLAEGR
jgi:hypothetical protein